MALPFGLAGLVCCFLPLFNRLGVVAGFIALSVVITFSLCPNGCLIAFASERGSGAAMPLNLALFNSIGNVAGFFGSLMLGVVVDRTCSYDAAYVIMGVVLIIGGIIVLTVREGPADRGKTAGAIASLHDGGNGVGNGTLDVELVAQPDFVEGEMHDDGAERGKIVSPLGGELAGHPIDVADEM